MTDLLSCDPWPGCGCRGAGLSFLFSWLFMLLVLVLFLLGGNVYTLVCQPWHNGKLLQVTHTHTDVFLANQQFNMDKIQRKVSNSRDSLLIREMATWTWNWTATLSVRTYCSIIHVHTRTSHTQTHTHMDIDALVTCVFPPQLVDTPGLIPGFNLSETLGLKSNLTLTEVYK